MARNTTGPGAVPGDDAALTLKEVASLYYPAGTSPATVTRHIVKGAKVRGGVVKLDAWKIGGRWVTNREAVEKFRSACTVGSGGKPRPELGIRHKRAVAYLKARGL